MRVLTWAYLLFVVYGSLVPLDYQPMSWAAAWQAFQATPMLSLGAESRADWIANGVLYLPLGVLTARGLWPMAGRSAVLAGLLACLLCAAVAVGVEFAQVFFPPRTVSINDLVAEIAGAALGAALAPALARWHGRVLAAWSADSPALGLRLLEGYAAAYLLLAFFPYDLLLSAQEMEAKWAGGAWGLLFAHSDRSGLVIALLWLAEAAICVPLGLLLARLRAHPKAVGGSSLGWGLALGLLLGLGIELGQFFIVSGVSQGASVLSRTVGVAVGAHWAAQFGATGLARARPLLARHALWLAGAYLPLLLFASGWFRVAWQGWAAAQTTWAELRLLPFYYHYYTSEAVALFSLGSVALMYLPLTLLAWARSMPLLHAVATVAVLSLAVEAGKLFLVGLRPDPTNILIAATACALALWFVRAALSPVARQSPAADRSGEGPQPPSPQPAMAIAAQAAPRAWQRLWPWPLLALALVSALEFPVFKGPLLLLLALCGVAVWRRPALALAIVAAALPLLDLAPWSGRLFWDEFDLLLLVCVAVAFLRVGRPAGRHRQPVWLGLAFALLALSLVSSSLRALLPWPLVDDNSFSHYYSAFNALRIVKGAVWAGFLIGLYRALPQAGGEPARMWGVGMVLGLAATVAVVVWERAAFVGLFDFAADHRVTGPFSAMHKGGAYIECYLAVGSAYVLAWLLRTPGWSARLAAAALLALASYAMMVTYSRNGYAALALVLLLGLVAGMRGGSQRWRRHAVAGLALLVVAGVAGPILLGSFASQRLAQSQRDLAVRQAHWADALALRDPLWATAIFGVGLGRFPESHFWRSREPQRAASFRLEREGAVRFLRLGAGATVYVEQIVQLPPSGPLQLTLDYRSRQAGAAPELMLCRKWLLTSAQCASAELKGGQRPLPAASAMAWQRMNLSLPTAALAGSLLPLKLAVLSPAAAGAIDITRLSLRDAAGVELLANGDFSQGMDRWLFSTDTDPPWHIHSLPVAVLFDQGWLGLAAWALLLVVALSTAVRRWSQGSHVAATAAVAVCGFMASGLLNTLIDAPRFLALILVLLWLCGQHAEQRRGARNLRPGHRGLAAPAPAP